jgi:hypothetical protein
VGLGELRGVLGHDAGEAAQRQRGVVVGRIDGRRRCAGGRLGGVAGIAGVRPHHQAEERENRDRQSEQ